MAIDFAELAIRTDYSSVDKATSALDRLTVAGGRSEGAARSMGGAWEQVGRQIRAASQTDADYFAAKLAAGHTRAAGAAEGHAFATGKVSRALETMIVHATGANHQLGQLSVAMADFGYGSALVTGVLAGLAAIALAYELITKNAREAHKAQDEAIKFLSDRFKPETGKGSPVNDAFDLARERQREDSRKLDILRNSHNDFDVAAAYRSAGFQAPFQSRDNEMVRVTKDLAEANRAVALAIAHGAGNLPTVSVSSDIRQRTADDERTRLAAERERGAEAAIAAEVQNQHRDDINDARRLNLVPESALAQIPITGQLTEAEQKHMESVIRLDAEYKASILSFKSFHAAFDDFKQGLEEAAVGFARQFSPGAIAGNVLGKVAGDTSSVGGQIGGLGGLIAGSFAGPWGAAIGAAIGSRVGNTIQGLFGGGAGERDAQRQAAASAHAMALQLDEVTKALSGDQLGAAIDALQIQLIQSLQAINDAMPGKKNEAERNAARDKAAQQEAEQEARARRQFEEQQRYAQEDLAVRNLRATGHSDQADLVAFQEKQAREMQAALDANKDAVYINTLTMVQNNELIAFQNNLLENAQRNAPSGFYAESYIGQFASPRAPEGYPTDSGIIHPPVYRPPASDGPDRPPSNRGTPIHIQLNIDGKVVTAVVIDNIDQYAASTNGTGTSRSQALDTMPKHSR